MSKTTKYWLVGSVDIMHAVENRPRLKAIARWLTPNPNLKGVQADIAQDIERLASRMVTRCPVDSSELSDGLRSLLNAKDALVRASMEVDTKDDWK